MNNKNSITEEDRDNFNRSNLFYIKNKHYSECTKLGITKNYCKTKSIASIESLVHDIANTEGEIFYIVKNKDLKYLSCKENSILDRMITYINYPSCWLSNDVVSIFPIHRFNPYFEIFIRKLENNIIRRMDLKFVYFSKFDEYPNETDKILQEMADALNDFIEYIRSEVQSDKFKAEISYCLALINNHHLIVTNAIDTLFSQQPQLLVLRMDIGYEQLLCDHDYDCEYMCDDYYFTAAGVNDLFCCMEKNEPLFEHLLGYVWKLDFSSQKGFYYHLFLFFDGSKVQDDVSTLFRTH